MSSEVLATCWLWVEYPVRPRHENVKVIFATIIRLERNTPQSQIRHITNIFYGRTVRVRYRKRGTSAFVFISYRPVPASSQPLLASPNLPQPLPPAHALNLCPTITQPHRWLCPTITQPVPIRASQPRLNPRLLPVQPICLPSTHPLFFTTSPQPPSTLSPDPEEDARE